MSHGKIKFRKASTTFHSELKEKVSLLLTEKVIRKANNTLKIKFSFYALSFILLYLNVYNPVLEHRDWAVILNYMLLGLSGILLAFNCSHDCVHNTFSRNKKINSFIYYITFNLQGVNAALWRRRHIASHHIFPNVDGCDADIDDNPFIRLSEAHPKKKAHTYQHLYATLLYCLYTLHWIFVKDFIYLGKKELANLKNQTYSFSFVTELIILKLFYLTYMIGLPMYLTSIPWQIIMLSFFIMHIFISLFFVLTLIISHLSLETEFPNVDEDGYLPYDYYEHQLAVSLDYHPTSKVANWIFGGFNAHSAHHLYPNLPHTEYTEITPLIKSLALKNNLPYHEKSIYLAVISHYKYLKKLSR